MALTTRLSRIIQSQAKFSSIWMLIIIKVLIWRSIIMRIWINWSCLVLKNSVKDVTCKRKGGKKSMDSDFYKLCKKIKFPCATWSTWRGQMGAGHSERQDHFPALSWKWKCSSTQTPTFDCFLLCFHMVVGNNRGDGGLAVFKAVWHD